MFRRPVGGYYTLVGLMVFLVGGAVALAAWALWQIWPPLGQGFLGLTGVCLWYGWAVEPYRVEYRTVEVPLAGLPEAWDGRVVAHLSDLHLDGGSRPEFLAEVFSRIRADLVVFTGDLLSGRCHHRPRAAAALAGLSAPAGAFAVLGNHDHVGGAEVVGECLREAGFRLLVNRAVGLSGGVWLVGVDDEASGRDDLAAALAEVPEGAFPVLLSHTPDLVEEASRRGVPLVLAGHTHGGQVCLPLWGPVFCFSRFYRRYAAGLFRVGETTMYVNRGLGQALLPFRFLCPPEVTLLRLRRAP